MLEIRDNRCLLIAEIAQAHDGSLGTAHAYIDTAATAGADAVKFQTHIAAAESSPEEPWRTKFSPQDETRYEYWQRMEFTEDQWAGLASHAKERGLRFLSSPFSIEAAELLSRVGVEGWKVASGELANPILLDHMASTGMPVLVSTGMARMSEVRESVAKLRDRQVPFVLMQCTSMYPCPKEKVGLNVLGDFRREFSCPVGLSDHSGTVYPGLAAAALGASVIEVHLAFSRHCFGPDVASSLTPDELRTLAEGVRYTESMLQSRVNKDKIADDLDTMRRTFQKSIVVVEDLPAGAEVKQSHLSARKPGTGIPVDRIPEVIGKKTVRPIAAGAFLLESDLQ